MGEIKFNCKRYRFILEGVFEGASRISKSGYDSKVRGGERGDGRNGRNVNEQVDCGEVD